MNYSRKNTKFQSLIWVGYILFALISICLLTSCKKNPVLNCQGVNLNTPYDPYHVDIKKLKCANNTFPAYYKHEEIIPPKSKSPWINDVCPADMSSMTDEAIFRCANATLWDALGDGRKDKRQNALDVTSQAINLTRYSSDDESRSKLYLHRGMLEMAMAIENNMPYFFISSDLTMKKDFENSLKLKPDYIPTLFFKDTLDITRESLFNHWKNVLNIGNATISRMKYLEDMGDLPDLSLNIYGTLAVYSGLPLSTTIPNKVMAFYDRYGCNKAVPGCTFNPKVAPFAVPGVNFTLAEAYARIGQKQKAVKFLIKSQNSPNFDHWRYKFVVNNALKNPNSFLNQFAKSGPYKQVMFDMYINKNRSCLMCHGRS